MKLTILIQSTRIKISEALIDDVYYIEQDANNRFYITSSNGYNGYEGKGHKDLVQAINQVKKMIKNYFSDRCEVAPKGFK